MALLFVGGAMNLIWIAVLSILVLVEKNFAVPKLVSHLIAALLIGAGMLLLISRHFSPTS